MRHDDCGALLNLILLFSALLYMAKIKKLIVDMHAYVEDYSKNEY